MSRAYNVLKDWNFPKFELCISLVILLDLPSENPANITGSDEEECSLNGEAFSNSDLHFDW